MTVKTPVPSPFELHLMNRLGAGYSRATWAKMRKAGGANSWFREQLTPARVPESALATALPGWFPDFADSPPTKWQRQANKSKGGWEYAVDLANLAMLRRMYSNRQLLETMVDFWSNHLHVPANGDLCWVHRDDYDKLLRRHALGKFDELLVEATLHPSMLLFLDNWQSVKGAPNENHGRELLELHTGGRTSGYTEQMVKDSAKILSGYTVDAFRTWQSSYDPKRHTTGPVQVLGFRAENASPDGAQLTRDYLRYLARHPSTARTITRKLAVYFISDDPSPALVSHLAKVFTDSGTDIAQTLRALVATREFKASAGKKVRTPIEDLIATVRVLQVRARKPRSASSFARALSWTHQSMVLYQWPRPDGPPATNAAWSSTTRILSSFRMHWNIGAGWWPTADVVHRPPASWLPRRRLTLEQYVDHLSRMVLGRPSTRRELTSVLQATGYGRNAIVTKDHPVASWMFIRLMGVLLDSPTHMSR